jgi:hypothetical protein
MKLLADIARARVTEVLFEPGVRRESYVRPTDQIVVFLDDCSFDAINAATGEVRHVSRKSGEIIWHEEGELAPVLINTGERPYRTLLIELKS